MGFTECKRATLSNASKRGVSIDVRDDEDDECDGEEVCGEAFYLQIIKQYTQLH